MKIISAFVSYLGGLAWLYEHDWTWTIEQYNAVKEKAISSHDNGYMPRKYVGTKHASQDKWVFSGRTVVWRHTDGKWVHERFPCKYPLAIEKDPFPEEVPGWRFCTGQSSGASKTGCTGIQ